MDREESHSTSIPTQTVEWAVGQLEAQWTIKPEDRQRKGEALARFLKAVGPYDFRAAILRCIDEHDGKFCPNMGQIRSYVRNAKHDERDWYRDAHCPKCHGSGWIYVPDPEADALYKKPGHQAVIRCREAGCLRKAVR
jgi:hypothetical protein